MGFRKIISFGDSSYVISLPKDWIDKNMLKKGESVIVEEEGDWLRVGPQNVKPTPQNKEITIDFNGNLRDLKTRVLHAYVNNYNIINIKRQKIEKNSSAIRQIISNFIGLDVVEQKDDRIIVNDVLDISSVSVYNYLRRVDRLIISMAEDVKLMLDVKGDRIDALNQKDEDVNKLCNLILKVLRRAQHRTDMKILNLKIEDIFYYWDLVLSLEEIGDQFKRMVRYLDKNPNPEMIVLFDNCIENYNSAMKSNYTKDKDMAVAAMVYRKEFFDRCDKLGQSLDHNNCLFIDRLKQVHNLSGNIAKTLLKLGE